MTELRFYHLQTRTLEQALPELLMKAYGTGRRIVVRLADKGRVDAMNEWLWTWQPDSFLPHGSQKDSQPDRQPVWLTHETDNPNGADMLVLTAGCPANGIADYVLCCDMFDGRDDTALKAARERWKAAQDSGHALTYWQQTEKGWEKKA